MGAAAPRRCLSPSPPPQSCSSHATRSSDRRGSLLRSPTGRTCSQSKSTSDRKAARHGEQHARPTEVEAVARGQGGRGSGPVWVVEEHGFGLAVLKSRTAAVRMVRAVVALLALVRVAFTRAPDAKDPTCARLSVKVRSAQRHSASWKLEGIGRGCAHVHTRVGPDIHRRAMRACVERDAAVALRHQRRRRLRVHPAPHLAPLRGKAVPHRLGHVVDHPVRNDSRWHLEKNVTQMTAISWQHTRRLPPTARAVASPGPQHPPARLLRTAHGSTPGPRGGRPRGRWSALCA